MDGIGAYLFGALAKDVAWQALLACWAGRALDINTHGTWTLAQIGRPWLRVAVTGVVASVGMTDSRASGVGL